MKKILRLWDATMMLLFLLVSPQGLFAICVAVSLIFLKGWMAK